jgi:hypothetical protein
MADHSGLNDITEQLRRKQLNSLKDDLLIAAADEIDKLRRELKIAKTQVHFYRNLTNLSQKIKKPK